MKVNPKCPNKKCTDYKTNRRVISSYKRSVYKPTWCRETLLKIISILNWPFKKITQYAMRMSINFTRLTAWVKTVKPLYQCNSCNKEFQGTQQQRR